MRAAHIAAALLLASLPASASARVTFKIRGHGEGFDDKTQAEPVGGNPGKTRGEQRRLALEHALELWAGYLDSTVPIDVDVEFADLGCGDSGVILGQAGAVSYEGGLDAPGANPNLLYPSALANSLAGRDLDEAMPDIQMELNTAPDDVCRSRTRGFYYGFDGDAGDANDLVDIVIHELAHGLGFSSTVDLASGALPGGALDAFSAQLFDLDTGRPWSQLTAAQRAQSANAPRRLVWNGQQVKRVAERELPLAEPQLSLTPAVAGFSGLVSDTSIGEPAPSSGVAGALVLGQSCTVAPPASIAEGWVALFTRCEPAAAAKAAKQAGAVAALLVRDSPYQLPPLPLEASEKSAPLGLPLLMIAPQDARNVQLAMSEGAVSAELRSDASHHLGTDGEGRPYMFASSPVKRGSSVSHVDPLLRPNQLMEPLATPRPTHNLALTRAFLQDIGWSSRCGDGHLDETEECDQGDKNDDRTAEACRSDCRKAHCGDGVQDDGEDCDDGQGNNDRRPDACRTNCQRSHCGDGVKDGKEQCDDGPRNSDRERGACRTTCHTAACGDAVVDDLEQCDDGSKNDDTRADACRRDCRLPRCGDGVVDREETCDEGSKNGKSAAVGCRSDCSRKRCGDGILDEGEACDGSADCSASCQKAEPKPTAPARTAENMPSADTQDAGAASGSGAEGVSGKPAASGCGCRIAEQPAGRSSRAGVLLVLCSVLLCWRRSVRSRTRGGA